MLQQKNKMKSPILIHQQNLNIKVKVLKVENEQLIKKINLSYKR